MNLNSSSATAIWKKSFWGYSGDTCWLKLWLEPCEDIVEYSRIDGSTDSLAIAIWCRPSQSSIYSSLVFALFDSSTNYSARTRIFHLSQFLKILPNLPKSCLFLCEKNKEIVCAKNSVCIKCARGRIDSQVNSSCQLPLPSKLKLEDRVL